MLLKKPKCIYISCSFSTVMLVINKNMFLKPQIFYVYNKLIKIKYLKERRKSMKSAKYYLKIEGKIVD